MTELPARTLAEQLAGRRALYAKHVRTTLEVFLKEFRKTYPGTKDISYSPETDVVRVTFQRNGKPPLHLEEPAAVFPSEHMRARLMLVVG